MTLALPVALAALLLAPLLWWWHRRARPTGDRPFSAFFLVAAAAGEAGPGRRLRAPLLLAIRLISLTFLGVSAAGPLFDGPRGTLVLAAGPFVSDASWAEPLTVVRAGLPPTEVSVGEPVTPVAAPPDWGSALLLGARLAPGARVVRPPMERAPAVITSGGAAALGGRSLVTATAVGEGTPALEVGDQRLPLTRRQDDWVLEAELPPGGALLVLPGAEPWPVCLPDTGPLAVADEGWPPAVQEVLDLLGDLRKVPGVEAAWRPGEAPVRGPGWAAFAPQVTVFSFGNAATEGPAPLSFGRHHPPPGAVVRRWAPLAAPAEVLLYAGDAPVVDRGEGPAGRGVRFGFSPEDSDLLATAGWPVLFADLLEAERQARSRCLVHRAGRSLLLQASAAVELSSPAGPSRRFAPVEGRVVLDGLDQQGLYRLNSAGVEAWLAVVPPLETRAPEVPALAIPAVELQPSRMPWIVVALLGLLLALPLAQRLRAPTAWLPPLLAGLALVVPPLGGEPGAVVLAVDTSDSMPAAETAAAVEEVRRRFSHEIQQIEGAEGVARIHAGGPPTFAGGGTRHLPLLTAAADLAGPGGVVVLVSDGRAEDGPVPLAVPVVAVPVAAAGPDGRVVSARALRLGPQIFVRASVAADRSVAATVRLGDTTLPVLLGPTERSVQAVLPAGPLEVEVEVAVPGDSVVANNRLPVPVEGGEAPQAVVVGGGAVGFAESAGLAAREVPAASLAEAGARLGLLRAMFIHDQPASAFSPVVLAGLERWVAAGGVLVLSGRASAFGPGGWAGTPLDELSPLRADPRPPGGAVAVALALDRSGSMARSAGGIGPEGVAALAAAVAGALRPEDLVSVLAFGLEAESLLAPTSIKRLQIEGLQVPDLARGGTRLLPALSLARRQLTSAEAQERVLVLITDGQVVDAGEPALEAAAAGLVSAGIRVVVVLTGDDPTREPLTGLARRTGGSVVTAAGPGIERFATASVLGALGEGLFAPGGPVQARAGWAARVGGLAPPVDQRVRAGARLEARVLAEVAGEPLLAEWAFGQGRVIALATDRWALGADQWAALLAPAVAPRPADATITVEEGLLVYVGLPTDPPPHGQAVLEGASGTVAVPWYPVGPGRAVAPLPEGPVEVLEVTSPSARGAVQTRITRPPPAEVAATGADLGALTLQAKLTGGRVAGAEAVAAAVQALQGRRNGPSPTPLLLLLALLALLLDTARWARPR